MSAIKLEAIESDAHIPFMDLAALHAPVQGDIEKEISRLVSASSFVLGPAVEKFENSFAEYCESEFAIGCNSGTSAIHMALCALDIGPGDEVITVSHTFVGTVWGILYCGAKPVFVDIDAATMNIDVSAIEAKITSKTKAIVPVHLYGQPVDMDPLMDIARRHGLYVIEDAAQAHGARYKGRRVGSLGDIACFSFYPGKNLGAWGEAGGLLTSNPELAARLRQMRDHGQPARYQHKELGFNYRMDAIQAAVLEVKLRHLDDWNRGRAEKAAKYSDALSGCGLVLPQVIDDVDPVWHLYVVRHARRDHIASELQSKGIGTGLHYPIPVHRQAALEGVSAVPVSLPVTESVSHHCLSLPLHPCLSDGQQTRVYDCLAGILETI
ncbi:DegT/DnrJ/EryC1/StrS family aminotransferase [Pseudomonadota bacterium]